MNTFWMMMAATAGIAMCWAYMLYRVWKIESQKPPLFEYPECMRCGVRLTSANILKCPRRRMKNCPHHWSDV
jgi:hypothetical protein